MSEQIDGMVYFNEPKDDWVEFDSDPIMGKQTAITGHFIEGVRKLDRFFSGERGYQSTEPTAAPMTNGQVMSTLLELQRIYKLDVHKTDSPPMYDRTLAFYERIVNGDNETIKELISYGNGYFNDIGIYKLSEVAKNCMKGSTYCSITELGK
ncbi:MAG: hypothetical protein GOV01_03560 [Candidatus Altiarchaeota archaeon]|nr:hypothetical protein [Candidatus Altiarchaeota archaeon]